MYSSPEQTFLLSLARRAISTWLTTQKKITIAKKDLPSTKLLEAHGTFVTLHTRDHELRGCIGRLESEHPLSADIIDNAISAAFRDPRFFPLTGAELPEVVIEISILTEPRPIKFSSTNDLLSQIKPGVDGIIMKKDFYQATFLPQVWEELPDKREFLSHLSLKAGLPEDGWKDEDVEFLKYQVEKFSE